MVIKKQGIKFILLLPGMISLFIIFMGVLSINVGIDNTHQEGFIVPILSGLVLILLAVAFFYYSARFLILKTKENDIISNFERVCLLFFSNNSFSPFIPVKSY